MTLTDTITVNVTETVTDTKTVHVTLSMTVTDTITVNVTVTVTVTDTFTVNVNVTVSVTAPFSISLPRELGRVATQYYGWRTDRGLTLRYRQPLTKRLIKIE